MAMNYSGALQGLMGGAGTGQALGGPYGALGGGLAGGLAGLFGGGNKGNIQQTSTVTPEVQQMLSQLLQQGSQKLQNPYQGFEPLAQEARTNFQQQTVPSIAERFTSMGGGALSSPAFASQLGQAGSGLDQGLANMKSQYGMQNENQGLRMLQQGMMPSFSNTYMQSQPGLGESLFGGALGAGMSGFQMMQIMNLLKQLQGQQ